MHPRLRILFVCGQTRWRSPTAERIYRGDARVSVRSAGLGAKSRRAISDDDLDWADLVLVMERRYEGRIRAHFPDRARFPPMESLEIPDEYRFMDGELVELIRSGTEHRIEARLKASHPEEPAPARDMPPASPEPRRR
jgi:predicted protein tyrosine phosphatase